MECSLSYVLSYSGLIYVYTLHPWFQIRNKIHHSYSHTLNTHTHTHTRTSMVIFILSRTEMGFSRYIVYICIILSYIQDIFLSLFRFIGIFDKVEFHYNLERSQKPPISAVLTREFLVVMKFKDIMGKVLPKSCTICLEEFEQDDEIRCLTNCTHVLHQHCLDRWMDHLKLNCPLCRTPILPLACQEEYNERLKIAIGIDFPNLYDEDHEILGLYPH